MGRKAIPKTNCNSAHVCLIAIAVIPTYLRLCMRKTIKLSNAISVGRIHKTIFTPPSILYLLPYSCQWYSRQSILDYVCTKGVWGQTWKLETILLIVRFIRLSSLRIRFIVKPALLTAGYRMASIPPITRFVKPVYSRKR